MGLSSRIQIAKNQIKIKQIKTNQIKFNQLNKVWGNYKMILNLIQIMALFDRLDIFNFQFYG